MRVGWISSQQRTDSITKPSIIVRQELRTNRSILLPRFTPELTGDFDDGIFITDLIQICLVLWIKIDQFQIETLQKCKDVLQICKQLLDSEIKERTTYHSQKITHSTKSYIYFAIVISKLIYNLIVKNVW